MKHLIISLTVAQTRQFIPNFICFPKAVPKVKACKPDQFLNFIIDLPLRGLTFVDHIHLGFEVAFRKEEPEVVINVPFYTI